MNFQPLSEYLETLFDWGLPMYDCIVWQDHKELFRQKNGFIDLASRRPHEPNVKYFVYSCSKAVTTAAALTLLEKGKIKLTDPLAAYFPECAHLSVADQIGGGEVSIREAEGEITLWNLFTMTAGFNYNLTSPSLTEAVAEKGEAFTSRDLVRALAKEPLSFDPGNRWQYSLCHDVLAGVVEEVTGRPFGDFVRETIFAPLGMENSSYRMVPDEGEPFVTQYRYNEEEKSVSEIPPTNPYVLSPNHHSGGAGMISTPEDFVRFGDAMAGGGTGWTGAKILSPETVALWHEGALSPTQARSYVWRQFRGTTYGLGVYKQVSESPDGNLSIFGWNGSTGGMLMMCPEARTALFYAQHTRGNPEYPVCNELREVLFRCIRG